MADLQIIYKDTASLIPYVNNARTHSPEQIAQIAASIKEFGFNNPILLDGQNGVVAGHGRLKAAEKLGLKQVPCIDLQFATEAQKKAYILADNRIAENSGWDNELLKLELEDIKNTIDPNLLGFSADELKSLIGDNDPSENEYTSKADIPHYEPSDRKPELKECFDDAKTQKLLDEIETAQGVTDEEKNFLRKAAQRHTAFRYDMTADYYAHASPEMQALMEHSALVIIDFDDAVKNGFIKLDKKNA